MKDVERLPRIMYAIILDQISTCLWFENGKSPRIVGLVRLGSNYCGRSAVGGLVVIPAADLMAGKFDGSSKLPPMRFFVSDQKELLRAWIRGFYSLPSLYRPWRVFRLFFRPKPEALKAAFEVGRKFAKEFWPDPKEFKSFGLLG